MPFTIIARVTRGNYEILLQRRAAPGGSEWGVPGGDYLPDESGLLTGKVPAYIIDQQLLTLHYT